MQTPQAVPSNTYIKASGFIPTQRMNNINGCRLRDAAWKNENLATKHWKQKRPITTLVKDLVFRIFLLFSLAVDQRSWRCVRNIE
jgi:hypothetical protein